MVLKKVCVLTAASASAGENKNNIMKNSSTENEAIRDFVRTRYGAVAEQAGADCGCGPTCCTTATEEPGCCGDHCCDSGERKPASYGEKLGYTAEELAAAPAGADLGLGCGNPLAMA